MAASEETENTENPAAEGENADGEGKKKGFLGGLPPMVRMIVLIGAPVVLILLIVLGLFLGGVIGGGDKKTKEGEHAAEMTEEGEEHAEGDAGHAPVYYDMPDMIVNMDSRGRKKSLLKIAVTLELGSEEDLHAVETRLPRVTDDFQVFLREIRIDDLRGSAGIFRLRQELLARIKPAVAPVKVKDVLFKELLIQ